MVYDTDRGVSVLFGGECHGVIRHCGDLWEWDGEDWRPRGALDGPGRRSDAAMALESDRRTSLLFGGLDSVGADVALLDDTWRWDGASWTELSVEPRPSARFSHGMARDPASGHLLLFGGCDAYRPSATVRCWRPLGDTWLWNGDAWQPQLPESSPSERQGFGMATAPGGAGVVLFGGQDADLVVSADTWTWSGASWSREQVEESPSARYDHALAWDTARDVVVLFGGRADWGEQCAGSRDAYCSDTWLWDGARWVQPDVANVPPPRFHHALVYDAARGRVVMSGGASLLGADPRDDPPGTWEWDGEDWIELDPIYEPTPREHPVLGYDAQLGTAILVGGESGQCREVEGQLERQCVRTWARAPAQTRPHLIAAFDVHTSRTVTASAADPSGKVVEQATIRARAGGLGHAWASGQGDGASVPGFALAVSAFGYGGWVRLAAAPGAGPDAMRGWTGTFDRQWRCGEPWCADATVQRWTGGDGHLYLGLAPLAPWGDSPEPPRIDVDYVELGLRYWRTGCEVPSERQPEGTPDGTPCTDGLPETEGETCRDHRCVAP